MMTGAEMAELVRVLRDAGLSADAIVEACERVAAAGNVQDLPLAAPVKLRSSNAVRQARYRARKRHQGVTRVTGSNASDGAIEAAQTAATANVSGEKVSNVASPVTSRGVTKRNGRNAWDKKERSPTPPKEKTTPNPPKGGLPPSSPSVTDRIRVERSDPVFAEIAALRGQPLEDMPGSQRDGSWFFEQREVERAKMSRQARAGPKIARLENGLISELEART